MLVRASRAMWHEEKRMLVAGSEREKRQLTEHYEAQRKELEDKVDTSANRQ